jgi:predicted dehydrogenase
VANLTASRVSQERLRRIRFFQMDGYLSLDLFEKTGDVLRLDVDTIRNITAKRAEGAAIGGLAIVQGMAAIHKKRLTPAAGEPLTLELTSFLRSLRGEGEGAASGRAGREALRVADAVRSAMQRRAVQWTAG